MHGMAPCRALMLLKDGGAWKSLVPLAKSAMAAILVWLSTRIAFAGIGESIASSRVHVRILIHNTIQAFRDFAWL